MFLLPEVVASNFGGTATLIGDPPNIMIGSYAGLTFNDFVINLTPVVIVAMITQILYNKMIYGRQYHKAKVEDIPKMISFLKEKYPITDHRVLTVGGSVLLGVIVLFILHGVFHMEVSVAALFGAGMIILLNRMDIVELLEKEIEWPSLVFFIMLFIVVGGAEQTGILQAIADWILKVCQGNLTDCGAHHSLGLRNCLSHCGQHPFHCDNASDYDFSGQNHSRRRDWRPLVGSSSGCLFWRERNHNRCFRECRHHRHSRKSRLQDKLLSVSKGGSANHDFEPDRSRQYFCWSATRDER